MAFLVILRMVKQWYRIVKVITHLFTVPMETW